MRGRHASGQGWPHTKTVIRIPTIFGDPGVDSWGEGKSKRAGKNMARRKVKNGEKSRLGRETQTSTGTNQKSEQRRRFGTGPVKHCPQGLFSPFFSFLRAIFFRLFRLSLATTICPWISEDESRLVWTGLSTTVESGLKKMRFHWFREDGRPIRL